MDYPKRPGAYNNVMNSFATINLPVNHRRDKNSMCVFHFKDLEELFNARDTIRNTGIHPNAFFVPTSIQAQNPGSQFEPVGTS
ncbi:12956_t:CDS:1, partial [Gigaspora rosea]